MPPTPKRRRQHGTGGVTFDRSKNRWVGTIEAGWTAKGTRRRIKVSGRTEAEAKTRLKERQRQIARDGLPAEGAGARATVKSWATQWLDVTQARLRPKTWGTYSSVVRLWIVPTIGHRRLEDLTPADVRAVAQAVMKAGRTPTSAQRAQNTLTKMLRDAVAEGHQIPQRVLMVPPPAAAEHDRDAIPLPDALDLLSAASKRVDGSRWVAALLQGMRQGECLGLTWDAVDLDAGTLDVSWQLQPLPYNVPRDRSSGFRVPPGFTARQLDGALHLVRPKSKSGTRVIPLVPWMTAALTAWREAAGPSPHGLVWPRPDGRPQTSPADRQAWHNLQDEAQVARVDDVGGKAVGRRYLVHEARHTTATLLLEAGVSDHVITAIMGHSSIVSSKAYLHASQALARRALDDVADRLGLVVR